MTTNPLVGKTLTAVYLAKDKQAIKFDVAGEEPIIVKTDGDCCSRSWVENFENPSALVGSPILLVEDIDMPEQLQTEEYEVVQFYGLKVETAKGTAILDYRNESNGYYGGSLTWPGEHHYGGVYGQNNSEEEWERIA